MMIISAIKKENLPFFRIGHLRFFKKDSIDNWIKENLSVSKDIEIIKILITPVKKAHKGAFPHLKDVYLWTLDDFRAWTTTILGVLRARRNEFSSEGDLFWRVDTKDSYIKNKLSPKKLVETIKKLSAYDYFKSNE